jgi:hypothetical protein
VSGNTRRFAARDSKGRRVTIVEHTPFLDGLNFEGGGGASGVTSYKTSNGQPLNRLSEDEFEVRLTGEILRRVK